MAVYKNRDEKKPAIEVVRDFSSGNAYETRLQMDMHTGTHLDMPLHMLPGGAASEYWHSGRFFSRCSVLDFSGFQQEALSSKDFMKKGEELGPELQLFKAGQSLLLKTGNSFSDRFDFSFTYLDREGAKYLAERNLAGVGIDALGIERDQPGHDTHKTLLGNGIWILEGLRLAEVPEGEYILALLPLNIKGVEALPVRAVLLPAGSLAIS